MQQENKPLQAQKVPYVFRLFGLVASSAHRLLELVNDTFQILNVLQSKFIHDDVQISHWIHIAFDVRDVFVFEGSYNGS